MTHVLFPCILLAASGSVLRLLLAASGREGLSAFFQDLFGLVILIVLCTGVLQQDRIDLSVPQNESVDYQKIYDDHMAEILAETEAKIAEQICNAIENEFGVRPVECTVSMVASTFTLRHIRVRFDEALISGFAIQKMLSDTYGGEVEVLF